MNLLALSTFLLSSLALLGSPGPGIASLVAVGRTAGLSAGLRYYSGLQLGLAIAAFGCVLGVASVLAAAANLMPMMQAIATLYLLWIAFKTATAPPRSEGPVPAPSAKSGAVLGLMNPKTYLAFVSLFAMRAIFPAAPILDLLTKWLLCVAVMIVVDLAWLLGGVALGRAAMSRGGERAVNILLATMLVASILFAI